MNRHMAAAKQLVFVATTFIIFLTVPSVAGRPYDKENVRCKENTDCPLFYHCPTWWGLPICERGFGCPEGQRKAVGHCENFSNFEEEHKCYYNADCEDCPVGWYNNVSSPLAMECFRCEPCHKYGRPYKKICTPIQASICEVYCMDHQKCRHVSYDGTGSLQQSCTTCVEDDMDPCCDALPTWTTTTPKSDKTDLGLIIGVVIGLCLIILAIIGTVIGICLCWRKKMLCWSTTEKTPNKDNPAKILFESVCSVTTTADECKSTDPLTDIGGIASDGL